MRTVRLAPASERGKVRNLESGGVARGAIGETEHQVPTDSSGPGKRWGRGGARWAERGGLIIEQLLSYSSLMRIRLNRVPAFIILFILERQEREGGHAPC
jgi:hypothetical protein